jgi:hypothetical protein
MIGIRDTTEVDFEKELADGNIHDEHELAKAVADRIVALRLRNGLSLETVATWLELNEDQMQIAESGELGLSDLHPHHIPLLCDLFGVDPNELFGDLAAYKQYFRKNRVLDDATRERFGLPKEVEETAQETT